jgi:hypothetical protein
VFSQSVSMAIQKLYVSTVLKRDVTEKTHGYVVDAVQLPNE